MPVKTVLRIRSKLGAERRRATVLRNSSSGCRRHKLVIPQTRLHRVRLMVGAMYTLLEQNLRKYTKFVLHKVKNLF
ncbi:unnamed protein product [Parnassius mnemosyne]|uniref:Uncharacterized protein n=1 Tax=Parnassius mnemosyne TaxID=213953 RepID=A0AAV1LYI8_9NEOP